MADQSGSARFQALFESALQNYQKLTGVTLAEHPLSVELQSCNAVEDITALLQGQARVFNNFQASDKIMKTIETTVSILTPLSDAASLADALGLVHQRMLMAYFTSLTVFCFRHCSHLQKQYRLVSVSYLMYVLFSNSYVEISLRHPNHPGGQRRVIEWWRTR